MRIITLIIVIFLISGVFWFFNNDGMPTNTQQTSVNNNQDVVSPPSSNTQNQTINIQKASPDQDNRVDNFTSFHTTEDDPRPVTPSLNGEFRQSTADISQISQGPSIENPGTDIYGGGPEANADTDVILIAPEDSVAPDGI